MVIWLFILLVLGLLLNVPIAICFGISTFVVILVLTDIPPITVVQHLLGAMDNWPLMAIPFFILAGSLMGEGGISKRLIRLASSIVGHLPGGLGVVTVASCMMFAAMCGSGPATTAAIGGIMIPAMVAAGYNREFATALTCSAGDMGPIIPPSILFITYGVVVGESIGALFIGGVVPGILMGIVYATFIILYSKKYDYRREKQGSVREIFAAFRDAVPALITPLIILGGIYGGVFTPTEAGVVACAYALLVGLLVYREIKIKNLPQVFVKSMVTASAIFLIIGTAMTFSWLMTYYEIPTKVANFLIGITSNKYLLLLIINIFLLLCGCFIDLNANIIVLTPILLPVLQEIGITPLHFGIIMVVNMCIGLITPPLGLDLYVASGISGVSLERLSRAIVPFLALSILVLMLITYIPWLATGLPELLMGSK